MGYVCAMPTPKLLEQVRNVARMRHLSLSTERAYAGWIRRYILFHNKKHPKEMAETEIRQFISDLAVNAKISASTQTVALGALLLALDGMRTEIYAQDSGVRRPDAALLAF